MPYEAITKQITKVNLIVSLGDYKMPHAEMLDMLVKWLDLNSTLYGAILHDKDVDLEGHQKTDHIHAVFNIPKRKRISTLINEIANACWVSPLAVTVKSYSSFEGSFQYLTHLNNKDKYQYPISDVRTNLSKDELTLVYEASTSALDFERLHDICAKSDTLLDVIPQVGLGAYQHYRSAIIDIWRLLHGKDPFQWVDARHG